MASLEDFVVILESEFDCPITEAFKYKVKSTGKKRRKRICAPGYKPSPDGSGCVPIRPAEKRTRKIGARHAKRDKASQGAGLKIRTQRKRKKAMKFRKMYGLSNVKKA